jgi:predicted exporter
LSDKTARILWIVAALALFGFCTMNLRVDNSITHFMPSGEEAELAAISRQLIDSELSRAMVLSVGGGRREEGSALSVAAGLAETLEQDPEVASLRIGLDDDQLAALHGLYFERLAYFVSDRPAEEIPQRVSPDALATRARRVKAQLASPSSGLTTRLAPKDPLAVFPSIIERFRGAESALSLERGQFVTADGAHAILFLETRSSPFDSASQAPLLASIETRFRELDQQYGGGHVLEQSGVNRIAQSAEVSMRADMQLISMLSLVGVSALFLTFFRSPRSLLIAFLPPFIGICFATATGILFIRPLHGVTVAFGVALIGVAIDYPIHVINHFFLTRDAASAEDGRAASSAAQETVTRLRPALSLGAATTITSFLALTLTTFPGVGEMGVFATLGIAAALVATLFAMPLFLDTLPEPPRSQQAIGRWLGDAIGWLAAHRAWLLVVPGCTLLLCALGLPRLQWEDDPAALTTFDHALRDEDHRVRERVSQFEPGRFVITLAESREEAIRKNDQVAVELDALVRAGKLKSARSLHSMLWSEALQRENLRQLRAVPDLAERIDEAFVREGFRPGAFAAFTDALEPGGTLPPPLAFEELAASPIGPAARTLLVNLGDMHASLTYLSGIDDGEALRAAISGIEGAHYFDQAELLGEIYTGYRTATLRVVGLGCALVFGVLWLRYRDLPRALAAFLPSLLVAATTLAVLTLMGDRINLLGLVGLILVMGMGVDYCIFVVDSAGDAGHLGATLTSLVLSALTTIFVFGVLGLSIHPALRSIGLTTGLGILLALLLAPSALLFPVAGRAQGSRP